MSLTTLGWSPFFDAQISAVDRTSFFPARVIGVHRDLYRLSTGDLELDGELRGKLRGGAQVAAGDFVVASRPCADGRASIERLLERRTKLSRKIEGRTTEEQILASNVDAVWILMGLDDNFSLRRLERYLILIREGGARPIVVLTKMDLAGAELASQIAEVGRVSLDAAVYAISSISGLGIEELMRTELEPRTTIALVGSSGVGKSTLANVLLGSERQKTAPVSEYKGKGRHTTTARELIVLPGGAMLIDTPGLRKVQLWDGSSGLASTFGDLSAVGAGCRFSDCTHEHEPGCEVQRALESGVLDRERFESYVDRRRELAHLERKQDTRAMLEEKRKWKVIHKAQRKRYKLERGDS